MGITFNTTLSTTDIAYVELAAAILRQAYVDYVNSLVGYKSSRPDKMANESPKDLEHFFDSDWAKFISFGHADMIRGRAYQTALSLRGKPRKRGAHAKSIYGISTSYNK